MRGLMIAAATALIGAGTAGAQELRGAPMKVVGRFDAELNKRGAMKDLLDLSGVACAPEAGGARRCLFVSDENNFAQFATVSGLTITPDQSARPALKATSATTGTEPTRPTSGPDQCVDKPKDETDGEGVALAGTTWYVIGSHGCSRADGNWRPMQMQLFRMTAAGSVEASWNLNPALQAAVPDRYGRKLRADGLTIEGIAADQDQVWIGLRAPVTGGAAYLLSVNEKALFDRNATARDLAAKVYRLKLDPEVGIRDLTWLEPRKLLVLAGPAGDWFRPDPVIYKVYLVDLTTDCRVETLAQLEPIIGTPDEDDIRKGNTHIQAKAEGLAVLGGGLGDLKLMVTYDKANQGMPRLYDVRSAPTPRADYCTVG